MKEIKMSFDEYQELVDTIAKQKETITALIEREGTIIVDNRYGGRCNYPSTRIPLIKGEGEFKEELERLYDVTVKLERELDFFKREDSLFRKTEDTNKWFWQK